jgi:hypothetical protein
MVWVPGGTFLMGSNDFYPEERPVLPLRMSPAPSAQIQPRITLIQLVFPYPCDNSYDMP